uniref:Uncharacterized protein n=1 Tax=Populus trichocarpa TaxID=3694 RepID=B9H4V8_POPTR
MDIINRGYDDFEQKIMDDHAGIKIWVLLQFSKVLGCQFEWNNELTLNDLKFHSLGIFECCGFLMNCQCVEDAVSMLKLKVYILEFRLDESTSYLVLMEEDITSLSCFQDIGSPRYKMTVRSTNGPIVCVSLEMIQSAFQNCGLIVSLNTLFDSLSSESNHHATPCEGPYLGLGSLCWAWRFKSQWAFNHLAARVDQLPKQSLLKQWAIFSTALVLMGHNLIAEGVAPGLLQPSAA